MGLGGITIMSDEEATSIRGFGWKGGNGGHGNSSVAIFGNSKADINLGPFGSAHSEDGYAAEGKHYASGANGSHAGIEIKIGGGHKGGGKPKSSSRWGGKGGKMGGGYGMKPPRNGGGHHGGGKPVVISFKVFAGGFSTARAH
jgi:hypothetical protein